MRNYLRTITFALLTGVVAGLTTCPATAWDEPPNWRVSGTGTTRPEGGVDVDEFRGISSHLGRFTGAGFHVLNPVDFTAVGQATWTASNGDELHVTYTAQIFLTEDPIYPFGFVADLVADGGTGHFANAAGRAVMTGGFTGVPGELFFDVEGTLHPNGR